jgi:8-oxo-dGTP pyrophosphatase MutT (NUDIX family)
MGKDRIARAAAIIIHDQSLLLMFRKKKNQAYYAFPGGTVELHEKLEDAVLREVYEETSLHVHRGRLVYRLQVIDDLVCKDEYFYLCDYISGIPEIHPDAIEQQRMRSGDNYYELQWVPLHEIEQILVYPAEIKAWLVQDLIYGFSDKVREKRVAR